MSHNSEKLEIRSGIPEASGKLVKPFQKVVMIAMQRVREEGTIDNDSSNRQAVTLLDDNNRKYKIIDCPIDQIGGVVISTGDLIAGLFIEAVQLDKKGNQINWLFSIQLPRHPKLIDRKNLNLLSGFKPKDVEKLADSLSSARKV